MPSAKVAGPTAACAPVLAWSIGATVKRTRVEMQMDVIDNKHLNI